MSSEDLNREGRRLLRGKILIVDDEPSARQALSMLLSEDGHEVREAPDGYKALGMIERFEPDLVLTDLRMPLMGGLELIEKIHEQHPHLPCIVMTAFASVDTAVEAMKGGAQDYLTKPLNFDAVDLIIARTLERLALRREVTELREQLAREPGRGATRMIGTSSPMNELQRLIDQVADSRATVLINGPSGTGKELVARLLHERSARAGQPFVPLHCAALPETLLESELFGHERGAFTGATNTRRGKFEAAHRGTLFLDEIGELTPSTQIKLLRVLQERSIERVGSNKRIEVDVRIVCATHRNLREEVAEGRFREDLYYRLNVINIQTPPLRDRPEDILLLARHFISKFARENQKAIGDIAPELVRMLERYDWPGNVRELENAMERAVVLCPDGGTLTPEFMPAELREGRSEWFDGAIRIPGSTLFDIERYAILKTYEHTGGNTLETAQILDISQRKVQYKLREFRDDQKELR